MQRGTLHELQNNRYFTFVRLHEKVYLFMFIYFLHKTECNVMNFFIAPGVYPNTTITVSMYLPRELIPTCWMVWAMTRKKRNGTIGA